MRAAIYCRISRDEAGDGLGVARQEQDCRDLAQRRGWTVTGLYVDNDVSAFSGKRRPEYQRLVLAMGAGQFDVVVSWAPERLHRSPRELEDFLELIERTGTGVETVKAGTWDVSTSHGRLVARLLGNVARAESERTGERVSRAHQQAKAEGRWRGPIPYGMRPGPTPGLPVPDEAQAAVVKDIYARILRGDALTRIAADLNVAGVRPRRGKLWTHTGASRLISSPALGGLVETEGALMKAAFGGVVDEHIWRSAVAALKRRPRGESRRPREKLTLLGGLMICAEHGSVLVGSSKDGKPSYSAQELGRCSVGTLRAAADAFVTEVVLRRLALPDARDVFLRQPEDDDTSGQAEELRRRRDDLAALVGDGLLPASTARHPLEQIAAELAQIEQARNPARIDDALFASPQATWAAWTQPQRREALRLLLSKISIRHAGHFCGPRVDPTRIQMEWATG